MKRSIGPALLIASCFLAANVGWVFAQANASLDAVTCRTNHTLLERGGEITPLEEEMPFSHDIKVFTNGTFQVKDGKIRQLEEGQLLRADGYLLQADGSIQPAFDHIAMMAGSVRVFKDGEGQALAAPVTLPDGSSINPDGTYTRPGGRRSRLVEGQLLTPDGAPLPALDTITLRNGRVVVCKSGTLIALQSNQITGLPDGRRVRGDGVILERDGSSTTLTDGQTVTVEGLRADW